MHFSCRHLLLPICFFALQLAGQNDSLKGFDREAIIREGLVEGHSGEALRQYVAMQQQKFVDLKYGLFQRQTGGGSPPGLGPYGCEGNDFENDAAASISFSTQLQGWLCKQGYNGYIGSQSTTTLSSYFPGGLTNPNSCNLTGCCPVPPQNVCAVVSTGSPGIVDSYIGPQYRIYSMFGTDTAGSSQAGAANPQLTSAMKGSKVLRINNAIAGDYSISRISKTVIVDSSNSLFSYAFISVLQTGHVCCDGAVVHFNFRSVPSGSLISAISSNFSAPSSQCTSTTTPVFYISQTGTVYQTSLNAFAIYNRWQVRHIDLSPYMGQSIAVEAIVTDCNAGGHFGMMYYDSQCSNLNVTVNGLASYSGCPTTYTLAAFPNIMNAVWQGPNSFSIAAASFTTNSSGIYTLTVANPAGVPAVTRTISIQSSGVVPVISPVTSTVCANQSFSMSVTGLSTYTWSNGISNTGFLDTLVTSAAYTVQGTDSAGCSYTLVRSLSVVGAPFYCYPCDELICRGKSLALYVYPGINYLWSTGVTGAQIVVSPQSTTVYTVANASGNCIYTKTITVSVSLCDDVVEGFMQDELKLVPNPARQEVRLLNKLSEERHQLIIRNCLGAQVLQQELTSAFLTISLSALPPGLYLVEFLVGEQLKGRERLVIE